MRLKLIYVLSINVKNRYWVDRGEYLQAVRYMNLLKGAARTISQDWLNEMRIFLEMQQAANTLLLYAIYSSQLR